MGEEPSTGGVAGAPPADPWLLTPGPLTTSDTVKAAMMRDLGSRDGRFIELNRRLRERLVSLAGGAGSHVCVPLQGSGTFVVEAMLGSFVPEDGKLLIAKNGAYGDRMVRICSYQGRTTVIQEVAEDRPVDVTTLDRKLAADPGITHVAVVHCETTTGILNPLGEVAAVVEAHGRGLLVDSMSAFGALPIDAGSMRFDALVASSNKCLEGVPGVGFCIARGEALERAAGNAHSLSLDLYDQWQSMESNGQWRFTPPTHCLLALDRALDELEAEGGVTGRGARYASNCAVLVGGMRALGFQTLLPDELQAPIIVTFRMPADPRFEFAGFYDRLQARGFVIYPGKLTVAESFRIGCIGRLDENHMRAVLEAVRAVLDEMGVTDCTPAR